MILNLNSKLAEFKFITEDDHFERKQDMKLYAWNIGMAATIPSNNGYDLNAWVIDEISEEKPDCFVLTEFVVSRGMDEFIRKIEDNYHWFISASTKKRGSL